MSEEIDGVRVVHAPRVGARWLAFAVVVGLTVMWLGRFTLEAIAIGLIAVGLGVVFVRRSVRRGVWATADDLLISNAGRRLRVPKDGATTKVVVVGPNDRDRFPEGPIDTGLPLKRRITWSAPDDLGSPQRRLYVIPGHGEDEWVRVEAGIGLTPPRLRALAAAIDAEIENRR